MYNDDFNSLIEIKKIRNLDTTFLKSPKVLEFAKEYYGCDSILGM